ncbi:MAG: aminopeptidase P family protein [Firmicutes bacterium]|nr:aminopeptidase P family protein [Bacillota bacterium]
MNKTVPERVKALQALMNEKNLDTYVILSSDAHQSEYVAQYWRARAYISGFTGSAGTVVVTKDKAACWVDGRYFLQGEKQLAASGIELMKIGEPGVPAWDDWVVSQTPEKGTVGIDGRSIGFAQASALKAKLSAKEISLSCKEDLIGLIWQDRPQLPLSPIWDLPAEIAGETRQEKLSRLRAHMEKRQADYYLIASLESSAWLLNYRGDDIHCTPVAYAFTLVGKETCDLFIEKAKVTPEMEAALKADGVNVLGYDALPERFRQIDAEKPEGKTIKIDLDLRFINQLLVESIPSTWKMVKEETDAVILMKAVKNPVEQENVVKAHIKDGAVMVQLLKYVKDHAADGLTECDVADWLDQKRCDQENSLGISFDTIAGYGPNGAIVHYKPERPGCAVVKPEGFLLVDSGAQYMEGTTDITRTIACGPLTDEMKKAYTLVLKGHLQLGHAIFKEGITGTNLDILARKPLWDQGLDYKHGTGHGVGFLLSVHEGPQNISFGLNKTKLVPGMVISDEPGFYPTGKFGVRIENLVMVKEHAQNEWGKFFRLEAITYCPYEREAIVKEMLTQEEIDWINAYHQDVYEKVSPLLDEDHKKFLAEVTRSL